MMSPLHGWKQLMKLAAAMRPSSAEEPPLQGTVFRGIEGSPKFFKDLPAFLCRRSETLRGQLRSSPPQALPALIGRLLGLDNPLRALGLVR
jgi:hypothetical protein